MGFLSPFGKSFQNSFSSAVLYQPGIFVYDTFTAANGTLISARPPDIDVVGGGWQKIGANNITIQSNRAQTAGAAIYVIDSGQSDCRVSSLTFNSSAIQAIQVFLRFVDINNHWYLRLVGVQFRLYEVSSGVLTIRAGKTLAVSTQSIDTTITAELSGNSLTGIVNGESISYSSSLFNSATKHGIGGTAVNMIHDNFTVEIL